MENVVRLMVAAALTVGGPGSLLPPVDGPVVRPFEAPAEPWAPGHRGLDLAAPPGAPVRAAGAGRVTFAGEIDGAAHVAVDHGGAWLTGYSYLGRPAVSTGEEVTAGAVVGWSGGSGPGHRPGVLHFGVRFGGSYVDPRPLLGACGPAGAARWTATLTPTRLRTPGIRTPAFHR